MHAGAARTFTVLLDWEDGAARDWAFTAWGEDGDVTVTNLDGTTTDHLPNLHDANRGQPEELTWGSQGGNQQESEESEEEQESSDEDEE